MFLGSLFFQNDYRFGLLIKQFSKMAGWARGPAAGQSHTHTLAQSPLLRISRALGPTRTFCCNAETLRMLLSPKHRFIRKFPFLFHHKAVLIVEHSSQLLLQCKYAAKQYDINIEQDNKYKIFCRFPVTSQNTMNTECI